MVEMGVRGLLSHIDYLSCEQKQEIGFCLFHSGLKHKGPALAEINELTVGSGLVSLALLYRSKDAAMIGKRFNSCTNPVCYCTPGL